MGLACEYRAVLRSLHILKPTTFASKSDQLRLSRTSLHRVACTPTGNVFGPFLYIEYQNMVVSNVHFKYQMLTCLIEI